MNIRLSDSTSAAAARLDAQIAFAFNGPAGCVLGRGTAAQVAPGTARTLAARIDDAFDEAGPGQMIGGALPFDRAAPDCLWLCDTTAPAPITAGTEALALRDWSLTPEPAVRDYARSVAQALEIMDGEPGAPGALQKLVLARTLILRAADPIPVSALMARLGADPSATAFRVQLPPAPDGQSRQLCGATPELLVEKRGARVLSHPLAGSARRQIDPQLDRAAAAGLEKSGKDHREHAMVVEAILDTLTPWCRDLRCPEGTRVTSTRSMWHLGTRIEGRLKDAETPAVVLASALHPTPAVGGVPTTRAEGLIRTLEPVARDFYAGAVGWCDARGDGAWYVAIRCAEISGRQARLYAGAGIVPGSEPMAEAAETGAKFGALLAALGLPADAGLAGVLRMEEGVN
ncbi:isochorismate synthase [Paracoccus lutimaris]|uniref:isochorismate synthase n=1 Tax=Paracoccus lutimaris TaxID=1490030 RepID=A0A368YRP2_9RHOB|nr:isochorismate synthase [Paracoccus lutimaris]RCW82891.1 isochorismate synthase [Paracoccus lutimaris]